MYGFFAGVAAGDLWGVFLGGVEGYLFGRVLGGMESILWVGVFLVVVSASVFMRRAVAVRGNEESRVGAPLTGFRFGNGYRCLFFAGAIFFLAGALLILNAKAEKNELDVAFFTDMPVKVAVTGVVAAPPEIKNGAQYLILEAEKLEHEAGVLAVRGKVLVKTGVYPSFDYPDRLLARGLLQKPADFEGFAYGEFLAKDGIYAVMYRPAVDRVDREGEGADDGSGLTEAAGRWFFGGIYFLKALIKEKIETFLGEPAAGIALGLLIGARASIPREILDDFQQTGLTHILAISGYNITLIINVFALIMGGAGRRSRFWVTFLMIFCFAVLTGLSASVVRASIMGGLAVFAAYLGRKGSGLQMLLFSGFLMVAANPLILLRDISFQLSFLSTAGLLILLPLMEDKFAGLPPVIGESLSVTLAVTVFTTPIILMNFARFSLVSPFANVLFLPLIPLIMTMSFAVFVFSMLFVPIAQLFGAAAWLLIEILLTGVGAVAKIPFAGVEVGGFGPFMAAAYYAILFLTIRRFRRSRSARNGVVRSVRS